MDHKRAAPYLPRFLLGWPDPGAGGVVHEREGTLVFVDISGFTAMSERLARKGKVGSEEVTEILNSTFARLLAVAYENGGSLVKFGGDALLLFFQGSGHVPRGVHAAAGMRRKLREIGALQSSAGNVRLRMSVGAHSGPFLFFVAGDTHRELIVTGPDASRTVQMESAATAGEILLSDATAAQLPQAILGAERDGGRLLARSPSTPRYLPGADSGVTIDVERFIPVALREHVGAAADPEHRVATVAFIHYDGTDELIRRDGAPKVAETLDELVAGVQHRADEHGVTFLGTDIDRDGGKIILVAGAPTSTGQDEERMLRCLRAIVETPRALPVRIGVNRGPIFAGDVGPPYRRTYTVMGDAVNLAARLMARSEPGQILATRDVLKRSRSLFATQALDPFMVKGKAEPVTAFAVGEVCGTRRLDQDRLPLIGRDAEMRAIAALLEDVARGRGRVADITAEGGLGKTRLVEEIVARTSAFRHVVVTAEQYEGGTPYFTVRRMLRALLGVDDAASPEEAGAALTGDTLRVAPELAVWLPLIAIAAEASVPMTPEVQRLHESFKRARLHHAVVDLIARLLPEPTVIVFEDEHWIDEASAGLISALLDRAASMPWLVVVSHRPRGGLCVVPEDARRIALGPLARDDAVALAKTAASDLALPPHAVASLADRSGGHPLFVQELVASASSAADLEALPDSIEALLTSRIDTLPPADRALLRYASVAGATFSPELLRDAAPDVFAREPDDVWERLTEFLVSDDGRAYRFKHALVRDVAYEGLPFRRRKELHARIGRVLEARSGAATDDHAEVLSMHFHRSQSFDKSWRYSVIAGDRAHAKFALVQAADFYGRAVDAARRIRTVDAADVVRIYEALGDVSERAGLYEQAAGAYRDARALLKTPSPSLLLKEGLVRDRTGRYSEALRWYARGLKATAYDDVPDRVELGVAYAGTYLRQGRYAECIDWCLRVLPDAERAGRRSALAHANYMLHLAYTELNSTERVKYREAALPIYEELGDLYGQANVLNNLGIDAYYEGRWNDAHDLYRRSKEAQEKAGDVVGAATATNNIGEILSDQGRLTEAEDLFGEALDVWRGARYALGVALATGNLGRVASRAGRINEARALLDEALSGFSEIGADTFVLETHARLAELSVFASDGLHALSVATATFARAAKKADATALGAMLHRVRGYALMQTGSLGEATDALDESERIARAAKAPLEIAMTLEGRIRLSAMTGASLRTSAKDEMERLFAQLGIVATPLVPLPTPPSASR